MDRNFEATLARQCAPTLAGLKPASLFRWSDWKKADFPYWRNALFPYDLEFRVLKACPVSGECLVYLFHNARLRELLSRESVRAFLRGFGYPDGDRDALLRCLSARLRCGKDFPHEIGVFLGYPLEDVTGFIENHGRNYTVCGCWKAYGNPAEAERRFTEYQRCTAFYCENVRAGVPLTRLLAA